MFNKWLLSITFLFLGLIFGLGASLFVVSKSTVNVPINSSSISDKLLVTNKEIQQANEIAKKVPSDWGEPISLDYVRGTELLKIIYKNKVQAIFQPGVSILYWEKLGETGECETLSKKYEREPPASGQCGLYQLGLYNIVNKKSITFNYKTPFKYNNEPYTQIWKVDEFPENYDLVEIYQDSINKKVIFTPLGKYFVYAQGTIEGCGNVFISTDTGLPIEFVEKLSKEPAVFLFDCNNAKLSYTPDESILAVRTDYSGMSSPGYTFTVLKGNDAYNLLPMVEKEVGHYINPSSIEMFNLDSNGISFLVSSVIVKSEFTESGIERCTMTFNYSFSNKILTKETSC